MDHINAGYNEGTTNIPIDLTNLKELAIKAKQLYENPPVQTVYIPPKATPTPRPLNYGQDVVDFSKSDAWVTAPFEFLEGTKDDFKPNAHGVKPGLDPASLGHGATMSTDHEKEGKATLEWRDHHRYPTLATRSVMQLDWSKFKAVACSIYSEKATGEVITLGIRSDNSGMPNGDYLTHDFTVDWTGWKEISLSFEEFKPIGNPVGWNKVDGVYFFTKAGNRYPDPRTVLSLADMRLQDQPASASNDSTQPPKEDIAVSVDKTDVPNPALNHDGAEISSNWTSGQPFEQKHYFQGPRALNAYFPKYDTGYVSFDTKGKPYIKTPAFIETLDEKGAWVRLSLEKEIKEYARSKKWPGVSISMGDPVIRFDSDGDLYVITNIEKTDAAGKSQGERTSVLQHSNDRGKTWTLYPLPHVCAYFERLDGHNQDCLKNPPVILQQDQSYFPGSDQDSYFLLPKKEGGALHFSSPIRLAHDSSVTGPGHSGGGNFCITQGNKIYFVYGSMPPEATSIVKDATFKESVEQWKASLPPIPSDHPARAMNSIDKNGGNHPATGGVPTFVRSYDRATGKLSDEVFVGYGGHWLDGHNWSAITADSKGILHVVVSGHIDPLLYTYTLKPGDITSWSKPIYVPSEPGSKKYTYASYASLNCDSHDTLLSIIRCDTGDYNHRIGILRKPSGGDWEKERTLLTPFHDNYHVWHNKVVYDLRRDRYFLSYSDQSSMMMMSRDGVLFYRFIWPESGPAFTSEIGQDGYMVKDFPKSGLYIPGAKETTVITSDDGGATWHLATTEDFAKP